MYFCRIFFRRGGLALYDLTQGRSCIGKIARQSKWDCVAIEWNPHQSHHTHLASTVRNVLFRNQWDASGMFCWSGVAAVRMHPDICGGQGTNHSCAIVSSVAFFDCPPQ